MEKGVKYHDADKNGINSRKKNMPAEQKEFYVSLHGWRLNFAETAIVFKKSNQQCARTTCTRLWRSVLPNNLAECFNHGTAGMILGAICTRRCPFCDVAHVVVPGAPEAEEPKKLAKTIKDMKPGSTL